MRRSLCWVAVATSGALLSGAAADAAVIVSTQSSAQSMAVSNTDLLQTAALASTDFVGDPLSGDATGGLPVLIDGEFGEPNTGGSGRPNGAFGASGGADNGLTQLTYTFDTAASPAGYAIASIQTFTSWGNGRNQQNYTVSYALVGDPSTFLPLAMVNEDPPTNEWSLAVIINEDTTGVLATGVAAVRFDFGETENDYAVYREIDVIGEAVPEPASLALMSLGGLLLLRRRGA